MLNTVGITESVRYTCLENLQNTDEFASISGISLEYCGREQVLPGYQFGPHVRSEYVIHIILSGKGVFQSGGRNYSLGSGDVFAIFPGVETVYKADREDPWVYIWIGFNGYRAGDFVKSMGLTERQPVFHLSDTHREEECVHGILEAKGLTHINELKRMSRMLDLFVLLMENGGGEMHTAYNYPGVAYVRYAIDFMNANFGRKITIDEMADEIGITRMHLSRIFKKETQKTPMEYLIGVRLNHAAFLLRKTDKKVVDIAMECGYSDYMSFSKAFKKAYRMKPSEYRLAGVELVHHEEAHPYPIPGGLFYDSGSAATNMKDFQENK